MRSREHARQSTETLTDLSGRERKVSGMLFPKTQSELVEAVRWARREKVRLQPISCGKNWGFGSNLPEEEDAVLVDLARLRAIRRVSWDEDWVELEPGVTQGILDDFLARHQRTHYFNVTGAGRQTSIIGNSLERGIGYFGSRTEDILDLEVLLADGSSIWTSNVSTNPFHTGLGPDLKGLFFHSNMGIVTAAKFRLRRRPACMGVVLASLLPGQSIASFVEVVAGLRREGLFASVSHLGNRQRLLSTFGPMESKTALNLGATLPEWTGVIPIAGPTKIVRASFEEITLRLEGICNCQLVSPDLENVDPRFANLVDLALGIPNDFALAGVANAALSEASHIGSDLDLGRAGLIHVTPTCRANGTEVTRLLALIDKIRITCSYREIPMTLNLVNPGMIAVILSVPFDRHNSASAAQAWKFANKLVEACGKGGFIPYRVGLEDSSKLQPFTESRSIVLRTLKRDFDPENLFARSKYDALWATSLATENQSTHKEIECVREIKLEACA